jgi:hypothetical protein
LLAGVTLKLPSKEGTIKSDDLKRRDGLVYLLKRARDIRKELL